MFGSDIIQSLEEKQFARRNAIKAKTKSKSKSNAGYFPKRMPGEENGKTYAPNHPVPICHLPMQLEG
jgi:hypothetical protein